MPGPISHPPFWNQLGESQTSSAAKTSNHTIDIVFNSEFQNYLTCIDFPQVRTHPPTKVREDIDRDKERRIKKFYWCKTYADFKHQEFLIKRSNSK